MSILKQRERRNFPRFTARIPINLSIPESKTEQTLSATTLNVSMNGIYCHVNRYIPLFTRTHIMFINPEHQATPAPIISQCDGIVVRIEPGQEEQDRTEYHVALCFQRLFQHHRDALREMIASQSVKYTTVGA